MGPGPDPPAVAARGQGLPPRSDHRRSGESLQTESTASVAMAKARKGVVGITRRRRRGLLAIPVLATAGAAVLALGVDAVSVPEAPARVDLDVRSGDEVTVAFSAPLSDGGSAVQSYEVCRLL